MLWLIWFGFNGSGNGEGALVIIGLAIVSFLVWVTVKFIQPLLYIIFRAIGGGAGSAQSQYGYQRHVKPEDLDFVAMSLLCGLSIGCLLFKQYGYRHV